MRRRFQPVITVLEGRKLLSAVSHHLLGGAVIETKPRPGARSITGTLSGTFDYTAAPPPNSNSSPPNYNMELRFFTGQLNAIPMAGPGDIGVSTSGLVGIGPDFSLGKFKGPYNGRPPADLKTDRLVLNALEAPFSPTVNVPSSFNLLTRVKSASGVYKHDVGEILSLTIVLSDLEGNGAYVNEDPTLPFGLRANATATVQPAES